MNLALERNLGSSYPEELDGFLDLSTAQANTVKFNRLGTLVAVGAVDGRVFIFDFVTRGLSRHWNAHVLPISSLCWSRNGRKLLTGSTDSCIAVWDVLSCQQLYRYSFNAMILSTVFNPRNDSQVLTLPLGFPPSVQNIDTKSDVKLSIDVPGYAEDSVTAAVFEHRGQYIITGSSKGRLVIYNSNTLKPTANCKQSANHQIKNIAVTRRGEFVLTNSQDRVIRCYDFKQLLNVGSSMQTIEPLQKFQDMINKTPWKSVCTSSEGDYLCAASAKSHSLHIWERTTGTLVKLLNGNKGEFVTDFQWHPIRPVILSVANGIVSIWTQAHVENWSAFAPDFTELEENRKFIEKESEFDLDDEDADIEKREIKLEEEAEIDIVTVQPSSTLCSSDEEDLGLYTDINNTKGMLWFLPVSPDVENPEESPITALNNPNVGKPVEPKSEERPSSAASQKRSSNSGTGRSSNSKAKRNKS